MGILGISQAWITVGPVLVINGVLLLSLVSYSLTGHSKNREIPESARRTASLWLNVYLKEWWVWMTDPVAKMLVRFGLGPNALSMIGFLFSLAAGILFANGLFGYAGWAMITGATFDIFDGRVARLTNQVTRSGGFFDASMDRFGEGVCFMGLAYYFRNHWLLLFIFAGLIGSMMVSYTKARAESSGIECKVGSMQRPERIVYLGVGSVLTPLLYVILVHWWTDPPPVLVYGALIIIAIMTNATAIYRMIYTMNALDTSDKRETESIPQIITRLSTREGRSAMWSKTRYGYDRSRSRYSHVVLFLVDGVDRKIFDECLEQGLFPNISRHIVERGSCGEAVSTFPTATGPASSPFVTGCFPGTCDVPGVRWFDRNVPEGRILTMNRFRDYLGWGAYAMDSDLSVSVRTIFEYSRRAVNIFGMPSRGCGLVRDPAFFRFYSMFGRSRRKRDVDAILEAAALWFREAMRKDADFVLYAFPSAESGPNDAKSLYQKIDAAVGCAVEELKAKGVYDDSVLILSSGYSSTDIRSSFDLNGFMRERAVLFTHPGRPREWLEADIIAAASGSSMTHLYFKKDGSWAEQSFFEDIERTGIVGALLEKKSVDMLAGRCGEGGVVVLSRRGRAHVMEDPDGRITYLAKGGDPFGFGAVPQVMRAQEAFDRTCETDYPDGLLQMLQIFRSARSGDFIISADPGCDINSEDASVRPVYGSGSLHRDNIVVPLMSSVSFGASPIRTADVFLHVMNILGIETEHDVDGMIRVQSGVTQKRAVVD